MSLEIHVTPGEHKDRRRPFIRLAPAARIKRIVVTVDEGVFEGGRAALAALARSQSVAGRLGMSPRVEKLLRDHGASNVTVETRWTEV